MRSGRGRQRGGGYGRAADRISGSGGQVHQSEAWLAANAENAHIATWLATTHGDLNEHNILVTTQGDCWLIDFYRTGPGHILRERLELETAIKFNLAEIEDLVEYQRFERRLLAQTS